MWGKKMKCLLAGAAVVLCSLFAVGAQAQALVSGHFETIHPSPTQKLFVQGSAAGTQQDDGGAGPPDFYTFFDLADETQTYGEVTGVLELAPGGGGGAGDFSNFTAGNIAVVDRGVVPFTDKILAAEAAGAIGVIIANSGTNTEAGFANVQVHVPVVMLFQNESTDLKNAMLNDEITAHLSIRDFGDDIPAHDRPIPEPTTFVLGLLAAVGVGLFGRRRRRHSA